MILAIEACIGVILALAFALLHPFDTTLLTWLCYFYPILLNYLFFRSVLLNLFYKLF
jgi:hypothetical protein